MSETTVIRYGGYCEKTKKVYPTIPMSFYSLEGKSAKTTMETSLLLCKVKPAIVYKKLHGATVSSNNKSESAEQNNTSGSSDSKSAGSRTRSTHVTTETEIDHSKKSSFSSIELGHAPALEVNRNKGIVGSSEIVDGNDIDGSKEIESGDEVIIDWGMEHDFSVYGDSGCSYQGATDNKPSQDRINTHYEPATIRCGRRNRRSRGRKGKKGTGYSYVPNLNETFVNTVEKVHEFLIRIKNLKKYAPKFFCDCEGWDLCRNGKLSLLQMTIEPLGHTWIFDVTVLQGLVFSTKLCGWSIRRVLEGNEFVCVWWDLRNDADALFAHFGIRLGLRHEDLQLMEVMTRAAGSRRYLCGLAKVVEMEGVASGEMTQSEVNAWVKTKKTGSAYFKSNPLGYEVFEIRPLEGLAKQYAGGDTMIMPMLWRVFSKRMPKNEKLQALYRKETVRRIKESRLDSYSPSGYHKIFSPRSFRSLPHDLSTY